MGETGDVTQRVQTPGYKMDKSKGPMCSVETLVTVLMVHVRFATTVEP